MVLRKDKEKVLDEVWTEERVKSFLDLEPYGDVSADFHMLFKAYQSMRASDFALFVQFFQRQNRDINATNPAGETVLQLIAGHQKSSEFREVLAAAGAH
jgi:hypothetical protein